MYEMPDYDKHILDLRNHYSRYKSVPSFSEAMKLFGYKSKKTIHSIYQWLLHHEYLTINEGKYLPGKKLLSLPIIDSVRAGFPSSANDDKISRINIESFLINNPTTTMIMKVSGDSMIEAGINPGDFVIVDKNIAVSEGQIVVAIVDNEYTLKYFLKDKDNHYYLQPANSKYENIYPSEELTIFGVVVGTFRKY